MSKHFHSVVLKKCLTLFETTHSNVLSTIPPQKIFEYLVKVPSLSFCTTARTMLAVWERVGPWTRTLDRNEGTFNKDKRDMCAICIEDWYNWWTTVKNRRSSIHGPNPTHTKTFLIQTKTITIRALYAFLFNCLKKICLYLFVFTGALPQSVQHELYNCRSSSPTSTSLRSEKV